MADEVVKLTLVNLLNILTFSGRIRLQERANSLPPKKSSRSPSNPLNTEGSSGGAGLLMRSTITRLKAVKGRRLIRKNDDGRFVRH